MFGSKRTLPPKSPTEYPEMGYEQPPKPIPQYEEPEPIKDKKSSINPFGLVIYVLLLASWIGMMWMSNLTINMFSTMGYLFLTMACIALGLLILIGLKTPALTFLKGFLYGKPILSVHRKDGQMEYILGDYGQGTVNTKKYGRYLVNPDGVMTERKSGRGIIHVVDSVGTAMTEPFIKAISVLREKFGLKDIDQIEYAKAYWSQCKKCGFKGVPLIKREVQKTEIDGKEKITEIEHEQCVNCNSLDEMVRIEFPDLKRPLYESLNYGVLDEYFKYNQNPDRLNVIIKKEVLNELDKEKGFPVRLFGILLGVGILLFLASIGLVVLLPKLQLWMAGEAMAQTVAPIIG